MPIEKSNNPFSFNYSLMALFLCCVSVSEASCITSHDVSARLKYPEHEFRGMQ
jgi:hypothetical protein